MHISIYYCTAIHSTKHISRLQWFITKENRPKKVKLVSLSESAFCEHLLLHVLMPGEITPTHPTGAAQGLLGTAALEDTIH